MNVTDADSDNFATALVKKGRGRLPMVNCSLRMKNMLMLVDDTDSDN